MNKSNTMKGTSTSKTTEKRKGKIKVGWIVVLAIVGVIALGLGGAVLFTEPGRREIMDMSISNVDFKNLNDGTYTGEYKGTKDSLRNTTVQVTVKSGAVTDIQPVGSSLIKDGKPVELRNGQTIFDLYGRVVQSQSLQVDVISGATLTSKTNLKAVENALDQAQKK